MTIEILKSMAKGHDALIAAQATAAENKRVVTVIHQKLKERYHLMEDAHMKQQYVIMINFVKSLRLSQPEDPKEHK